MTWKFELSDGQKGDFKKFPNKKEKEKLTEILDKWLAPGSEIKTTVVCNAVGTAAPTGTQTGSETGTPTGSSPGAAKTSDAAPASGGDILKGPVMGIIGAGLGAVVAAVL